MRADREGEVETLTTLAADAGALAVPIAPRDPECEVLARSDVSPVGLVLLERSIRPD